MSDKVAIPRSMLKWRVDVARFESLGSGSTCTSIILITFLIAGSRLVSTGGDK